MESNISGVSPSFPVSEAASVTNRASISQPDQTSNISANILSEKNRVHSAAPRFSREAAILSLSPEALERSRSKGAAADNSETVKNNTEIQFSAAEKQVLRKLQARDIHVKTHEQQHMAAGGAHVRGGPTFQYTMGPDGKSYAVGGEVQLDVSPVPNNPEATIAKAQTIRRAALAPSDPSGADQAIAASATQMENNARLELLKKSAETSGQVSDASPDAQENQTHFYIKSYQNILDFRSKGSLFNQIA